MSAYTRGPWRFQPFSMKVKDVNQSEPHMKVVVGANGQGLAYTVGLNNATDLANARLIAAAPELLEAAKIMHAMLTERGCGGLAGAMLGESAIRKAEQTR